MRTTYADNIVHAFQNFRDGLILLKYKVLSRNYPVLLTIIHIILMFHLNFSSLPEGYKSSGSPTSLDLNIHLKTKQIPYINGMGTPRPGQRLHLGQAQPFAFLSNILHSLCSLDVGSS